MAVNSDKRTTNNFTDFTNQKIGQHFFMSNIRKTNRQIRDGKSAVWKESIETVRLPTFAAMQVVRLVLA